MATESNKSGMTKKTARREEKNLNLESPIAQYDSYTDEEREALYNYTISSHINYELGTLGFDNMDDYYKEMAINMDKAIAHTGFTEDYVPNAYDKPYLSRGGGAIMIGVPEDMKFSTPQKLADYINKNCVFNQDTGEIYEYTNAGYTSITQRPSVSNGIFSSGKTNPVVLDYVMIEKGVRGAFVSGGKGKVPISYFEENEAETIIERGISMYIAGKATVVNGKVHVPVVMQAKK